MNYNRNTSLSSLKVRYRNKVITGVTFNLLITLWGILVGSNLLFLLLFLLWGNMILYSLFKLGERILLFAYGVAFYIFLLGRDCLEQFFLYPSDTPFSDKLNNHAYFAMICSIIGVWVSFSVFCRRYSKSNNPNKIIIGSDYLYKSIRKYSKISFYATYPFAIIINLVIGFFVMRYGYYSYYTDLSGVIAQSPILYLFSKLEIMMPASFAVFMATLPDKDEFKKLSVPYVVYLIITLGCGQRSTFLLGLLLFFIFLVYMQQIRPQEKWFSTKYMTYAVMAVPLIAIGGSAYKAIRFGNDVSEFSVTENFCRFFYDQGVTSNIIKRAYEYENSIPKQEDPYTLEFLHSGLPARLLGNEVYQGNNLDYAYKGGSFTHSLGYVIMGNGYLMGGGTGSSFIAELYYDFGYLGVLLGSALYGFIFSTITNFKNTSIFTKSLSFIITTQLLWAPRASFSGFLAFLFAPSTILLILFIFGTSYVKLSLHYRKQHLGNAR